MRCAPLILVAAMSCCSPDRLAWEPRASSWFRLTAEPNVDLFMEWRPRGLASWPLLPSAAFIPPSACGVESCNRPRVCFSIQCTRLGTPQILGDVKKMEEILDIPKKLDTPKNLHPPEFKHPPTFDTSGFEHTHLHQVADEVLIVLRMVKGSLSLAADSKHCAHGNHGVLAAHGLCAQQEAVCAVQDGVGDVGRLCARWAGRLEWRVVEGNLLANVYTEMVMLLLKESKYR